MKIFIDLDGVLADFVTGICKAHGLEDPYQKPENLNEREMQDIWKMDSETYWEPTNNREFWVDLPMTPEAEGIMDAVLFRFQPEQVCILSTPTLSSLSLSGKQEWICKHFPMFSRRYLLGCPKSFCAAPGAFLIDDHEKNIQEFQDGGGDGFLFPRAWNRNHAWANEQGMTLLRHRLSEFKDKFSRGD